MTKQKSSLVAALRDETPASSQGNGMAKRVSDAFDYGRSPRPSLFGDISKSANNNVPFKDSNHVATSSSSGIVPDGESNTDDECEIPTGSTMQCPLMSAIDDYMRPSISSGCVESVTPTRRTLTKTQLRNYREAFRLFDKNGDGNITTQELGNVMASLGQHAMAKELKQMLDEIDSDGDGTVNFHEFVDILEKMTEESCESTAEEEERELRDAFRVFDKHNRGYITASDLRAVLRCLGEQLEEDDIEEMIKEVDVDGDGKIDFYEFVHSLGEPENSQDDDEDDVDDADVLISSTFTVPSVTTSEIESQEVKVAMHEEIPVGLSKRRSLSESITCNTTLLSTPNSRSNSRRGSRSASPETSSLQRPFGANVYDRARSPSLKEPVSTSFLSGNIPDTQRRPSLRSTLVSEEVAMISRASFRESYNAMVKPKDTKSSEDGLNLNIPELEALRASYRALSEIGDQTNDDSSQSQKLTEQNSVVTGGAAQRRMSYNLPTVKIFQTIGRDFARESFDLDDETDHTDVHEILENPELSAISPQLTYRQIPGFGASAFYLSREELQYSGQPTDIT